MRGSIRRRGEESWEITIDLGRDTDGRRLRRFVSVKGRKKDADRRLRELLTTLDKGLPIAEQKITVGEWLDTWFEQHIVQNGRVKTQERYRGIIDRHLKPAIGHVQLPKLTPADVKALEAALLNRGMAPAGVELVHIVLSGAMKHALRMELIWRNPVSAVSPPRRPHKELVSPELDDVRRILDRGHRENHPLYPAIHLVAYSGLRRGECLGLTWENTDLDNGAMVITRSVVRTQQGIVVVPTKTDKSRRRIDIDTDTVAVLRAHKVRQLEHRLMLGQGWEDNDLLFPDPIGRPLNPMKLTLAFQSLARQEGLNSARLHDLRHFHASALFQQGESPVVVSQRLGHQNIVTTIQLYGHLFSGKQKEAAETFAEAMRGT